eukprot:s6234_g4.t1
MGDGSKPGGKGEATEEPNSKPGSEATKEPRSSKQGRKGESTKESKAKSHRKAEVAEAEATANGDATEPKTKRGKKTERTPEEAEKAAQKSRKSCAYHLAKRNAVNSGATAEQALEAAKAVACKLLAQVVVRAAIFLQKQAAKARIASLQATLQRKDSVDQEPVIAGGLFSFDRVFAIGCAHA